MPVNLLTDACISKVRGALGFWSPASAHLDAGVPRSRPRLHGRVQIVDVFSLEVVSGYSRDPQGRLLLHSAPSVAEGRSWSLAKAAQLIRNDARPNRWVALQRTTAPGVCSGPAAACSAAVNNWLLQEAMQKPVQHWCR